MISLRLRQKCEWTIGSNVLTVDCSAEEHFIGLQMRGNFTDMNTAINMSRRRLIEGDIFYVKVDGMYFFARLLLDVDKRILSKEPQHRIKFYSGCYLIEVYEGIYEKPQLTTQRIALPSQYTFKKFFYSKSYKIDWVLYDHQPIDYRKIDFPETIETGDNGFLNFRKFDLSIPTKTLRSAFVEKHKLSSSFSLYTGSICSSFYQMIDEAAHLQGRDDLMIVKRTHFLNNSDLRLAPDDRTDFYKQIGTDPNFPYYQFALGRGFDFGRFYDP